MPWGAEELGGRESRLESEGGEVFAYLHIIMIYDIHNIFRTLQLAPAVEAGAGGRFLAGGGGGGWLRWPRRLLLRQRYEPA